MRVFLCVLCVFAERTQPVTEPEPKPELAPAPEVLTASDGHPEPKAPAGVEVRKVAAPSTLAATEDAPSRPSISLDTIVNQEVYSLASDLRSIMQTHHLSYASPPPPRLPAHHGWLPNSRFSHFVVPYVSPVPCQGHVKTLCERMDRLIPPLPTSSGVASPVLGSLATPPPTPKTKPELSAPKSASCCPSGKMAPVKETKSTKAKSEAPPTEVGGEIYSPSHVHPDIPESKSQNVRSASGSGSGLLAGSLIGQLKPEVFSSLVEIFKDVTKNTVKFYIYSGDEWEESEVCKDIKVRFSPFFLLILHLRSKSPPSRGLLKSPLRPNARGKPRICCGNMRSCAGSLCHYAFLISSVSVSQQ